jgi:hypothetical protein
VRTIGGQILVASTKDQGSTFAMQIPFFSAESSSNPFQLPPISTPFSEKPGPLPGLHLPERYKTIAHIEVSEVVSTTPASLFLPSIPLSTSTSLMSTPYPSGSTTYTPQRQHEMRSPSFFPPMEQLVVLIADDNNINIRVLENRIKKMGHIVHTSKDGHECFEKFVQNHHAIDFVLMDIDVSFIL